MRYLSTNNKSQPVSLAEAILHSRADDGGLFWPERLPEIPRAFFNNFSGMTFNEIAYVVSNMLFSDVLSSSELKTIIERSFNFPLPVRKVGERLYSAELFHGPTLAFKDFGARFMARMLSSLLASGKCSGVRGDKLHVLIATTGNTGSAVANGFRHIPGVEVYILFPRGTAERQLETQFTTLGDNIHALEVQGSIDDCHALVAQAFADRELAAEMTMTSANSVNIVRLLPQTFCYFYAVSEVLRLAGERTPVTVAIPAGNLGNLTAALAARAMGLKMDGIIAAENSNDYLTRLLATGAERLPHRPIPTLASACDKSMPTNMPRLRQVCRCPKGVAGLREAFSAVSIDDAGIIDGVNHCLNTYNYIIDPHTALAYQAMCHALPKGNTGLIMATGHPAKSLTAMNAITGRAMELPLQLTNFMTGKDQRQRIRPTYDDFRKILLDNH